MPNARYVNGEGEYNSWLVEGLGESSSVERYARSYMGLHVEVAASDW